MTVWIAIECPHCHSTDVVKNGFSGEGKQRYLCQNEKCNHRTFIRNYSYNGCRKEVKKQIPKMGGRSKRGFFGLHLQPELNQV
ncbi:MAG: IS1 family transposase [Cyanobacteria bacterium P01_G01_bin.49]